MLFEKKQIKRLRGVLPLKVGNEVPFEHPDESKTQLLWQNEKENIEKQNTRYSLSLAFIFASLCNRIFTTSV